MAKIPEAREETPGFRPDMHSDSRTEEKSEPGRHVLELECVQFKGGGPPLVGRRRDLRSLGRKERALLFYCQCIERHSVSPGMQALDRPLLQDHTPRLEGDLLALGIDHEIEGWRLGQSEFLLEQSVLEVSRLVSAQGGQRCPEQTENGQPPELAASPHPPERHRMSRPPQEINILVPIAAAWKT